MKRVKMTATAKGAPQGHTVKTYADGEVHDLPDDLADAFIRTSVAKHHGNASDDEGLVTETETGEGDNADDQLEGEIDPNTVSAEHVAALAEMGHAVALIVNDAVLATEPPVIGEHDPHENGGLAPVPGKPATAIDPSKAANIEDATKQSQTGKPGKKTGK